jgi:hypothetical protein
VRVQKWFLDTSVIGGCHDEEFALPSRLVFREIEQGRALAIVSLMTVDELRSAPTRVQRLLYSLPDHCVEYVSLDEEAAELADAYVSDGVVGQGSLIDAQQVAVASLQRADVIVSWNFRHIVNLNRIRLFAATNLRFGLVTPEIRSPLEVLSEKEEGF